MEEIHDEAYEMANGQGNGRNGREDPTIQSVLKWTAGLIGGVIIVISGLIYQNASDQNRKFNELLNNHESRIVKTETCLDYIQRDLITIKDLTKEIRDDQVRRNKVERR